ncbi:MAG: HEAT repeat domain-containing protein [Thermodesulfobacteriota bacterium]
MKYGPIVDSFIDDPSPRSVGELKTEHGSTDWTAVEEALLSAVADAQKGRYEKIYGLFELLGYVDDYLDRLKNGKDWERALAAERLGAVRCGRAVPALISALDDGFRDVHNMSIYALGLIGDEKALPAIIESFKRGIDDYEEVSLRIVKSAILSFGPLSVQFLRPELKNPAWRIRAAVVNILGDIKDPSVFEDLLAALKDPEPDIRAKAARGLGNLANPAAVRDLLELAGDPYWLVRLHTVRALGLIGAPESIEVVKGKLLDSNWQVRRAAAEALGHMEEDALPALTDVLLNNHDRYAREQVLEELQRIGMIRRIIEGLGEKREEARRESERTLHAVIINGALSPIVNAMEREGPEIRKRIIGVLRRAGGAPALEVITNTIDREVDAGVREAAEKALEALQSST